MADGPLEYLVSPPFLTGSFQQMSRSLSIFGLPSSISEPPPYFRPILHYFKTISYWGALKHPGEAETLRMKPKNIRGSLK